MPQEIIPGLHLLEGKGANCNAYLLEAPALVLIDTGLESGAGVLEKSISSLGYSAGDVGVVLHTHGHADHIGADALFPNAKKWMSAHDAKFVNARDYEFTAANWFSQNFFPKIKNFYSANQVFEFGKFSLEVVETPGHTRGSVSFYDKKNSVLFSGDTIFDMGVGRYDLVSASKKELLASVEKISRLEYDFLLPGHGKIRSAGQKKNIGHCLLLLKNPGEI
ncbi:MAG: MBL fold metallo-hydrolase [archaeon]|nr:MBL fold metallo-hydrolase [archaeon]